MTVNSIKTIAASATDSPLGTIGGQSQYLSHLIIKPATTAPGAVTLKDGGGNTLWSFAGGTLADVKPFTVPFNIATKAGLTITTGTNVSVDAFGSFT